MTRQLPQGWDTLPPPVVGFEFEFTPNPFPSKAVADRFLAAGTQGLGYITMPLAGPTNKNGYFLSNGALVVSEDANTQVIDWQGIATPDTDVRLIEYASAAANSIRWAVAAKSAGVTIVPRIVEQGNNEEYGSPAALYHRNAHAHLPHSNKATGAHQSHLFWAEQDWSVRDEHNFENRFASFLAAIQVITGEGIVGDVFHLSQQALHINAVVANSFTRASDPKPGYMLRKGEHAYAGRDQQRLEIRGLDQSLSHFASFVGTGVTSAFVRCLRFGDERAVKALPFFASPLSAMKDSNTILGLSMKHQLGPIWSQSRSYKSVLEMLGIYLDFILVTSETLPLTEEEVEATHLAKAVLRDLESLHSLDEAELLADRLGWAGRATAMLREVGGPLVRTNIDAVAYDLKWDRVYRKGRKGPGMGQEYWSKQPSQSIVPAWMVEHCVTSPPPGTRAEQFVQAFTDLQRRGYNPTGIWGKIAYADRLVELSDPTGQALPRERTKAPQNFP